MEKALAPHSSALAWKIPWTQQPGGLQSMGSLSVGHNWATSLSLFTFTHWRRKWQPTPVFLPWESQGRGSLVGCRLWGHTVGHDWSDLAAAKLYHNNSVKKNELFACTLRRCLFSALWTPVLSPGCHALRIKWVCTEWWILCLLHRKLVQPLADWGILSK